MKSSYSVNSWTCEPVDYSWNPHSGTLCEPVDSHGSPTQVHCVNLWSTHGTPTQVYRVSLLRTLETPHLGISCSLCTTHGTPSMVFRLVMEPPLGYTSEPVDYSSKYPKNFSSDFEHTGCPLILVRSSVITCIMPRSGKEYGTPCMYILTNMRMEVYLPIVNYDRRTWGLTAKLHLQ